MKKIIGIVLCMLLMATVIPVSGTIILKSTSIPFSIGKTLYVGGSGPNNYTSIQDAIDDALHGDTIFVYDDSSPYYENVIVDKSITLIGEDRDTTIIDSSSSGTVVYVTADDVTIGGFTIQNSEWDGILITQEEHPPWDDEIQNVTIYNNIIKKVSRGIFGITLINGEIYGNYIEDIDTGIKLSYSSNNNVSGNFITKAKYRGIEIQSYWSENKILDRIFNNIRPPAENNIVYGNTVENNRWGIDIGSACIDTKVYNNNIINNHETGLKVYTSAYTEIKRNNFIQTEKYIGYKHSYFSVLNRISQYITNSWNENYWGEPYNTPLPINGEFHFVIWIPTGLKSSLVIDILDFPLVKYDKNPAQEPYDV